MAGLSLAKRVIITGASSGVGAAIARVTAHRGHSFFLTGRNQTNLAAVSKASTLLGAKSVTFGMGDVGHEHDVNRLVDQAVADMGGIDVAVLNAGTGRRGPIEEITPPEYRDVMRTNVKGVYLWLNKVVPKMKAAKKGQIIVIGSIAGLKPSVGGSIYSASKYALEGMYGCVRQDLRGSGVKIAMINPHSINTPWWDDFKRGAKTPEQRAEMLTPEDVAYAVDTIMEQPLGADIDRIVLEGYKPYSPPTPKSNNNKK